MLTRYSQLITTLITLVLSDKFVTKELHHLIAIIKLQSKVEYNNVYYISPSSLELMTMISHNDDKPFILTC